MAEIRVGDAMAEDELLAAVVTLCKWLGLMAYHTRDSRRSQPGFPDLVIAGPQGVLFRELKTAKGRLTGPQMAWLSALNEAKADAAVWRPADLSQGNVQRELEALRG